ncbi:ABC transporter permease [Oceanobacillus caeni]|uniref:ABC transporter permease n=1 Tax=Oceanobacillus caeni TaxID=405946 RepID=A0ABR5MIC8_9BACI|nr:MULTISPECIES: ABC transporter permease [Bacillaceae]KKE79509.1 ABC transporter permease [Bacilli bacterium VT-13-104]PZD89782.1 ABC transporter permease [Bacilli bacterium]KPH73795.1 ABC transporter permease [Oceanobacillus caeni]MBU8791847.1 ABC transporter permease [Oceanobacillus caeni]MCR1836021.1 ABC transporter permease [Oceanobacillus caeni]
MKSDQQLFDSYLKERKKEKKIVLIWQFFILIMFFALWEIASRLYWIDPLLFSSPSRIFTSLIGRFANGSMFSHLSVTLFETILGFIIGTLGGILLATLLWSFTRFSKIMDPYIVVLNAMPKVALGPIIIVALGPGYLSIIAMGFLVSVIITTINIFSAYNEVDPNYSKVLKSFGATRWQCFKEAVFPATMPTMISTLKVNVGLSWVGVIVGEYLVSKQGLGYLIIYGFQVFDFTLVMSSLVLIAILAAIMYKVVEGIERWLIKHAH